MSPLEFRAQTDPMGPAIQLSWRLPEPSGADEGKELRVRVLRRERRFPGRARRGWAPVDAGPGDLTDGVVVYDSADPDTDFEETRSEWEGGNLVTTTRRFRYRGTPRDREYAGYLRSVVSAAGDPISTTVQVVDRAGLTAGTTYYYTAFAGPAGTYSRATQASALATGSYQTSLFAVLPQADRVRDTDVPAPFTVALADAGKGQLQRYVETVEVHADLLRGLVEGLRDLYDVRRADARLLPRLAHQIGWSLKDYLDEDAQRGEVMFAPEFYRTVGSSANITAMINRLTGWDARVKEFVRSVLTSFDTSRREPLQGGEWGYADGTMTGLPGPPYLSYRKAPPGSVDTADAEAMYRLRNRLYEDTTAYSYDCGKLTAGTYVRDDQTWYTRDTIGIYIVPDVDSEVFVLQAEWERIRQILQEFLPINVRAIFILMPGVVVEQEYDATRMVTEQASDAATLLQEETYGEGSDSAIDQIPAWLRFLTNDLAHRSVDTTVTPVNTNSRTWHTGLGKET